MKICKIRRLTQCIHMPENRNGHVSARVPHSKGWNDKTGGSSQPRSTACSWVPGACGMLLGRRWLLTRCWVTAHQMLPRVGGSSSMWYYRPLCQQPPSSTKTSFHHSGLSPSSCRRWFDDTTIRLSSVSRIHIEKDFLNDPMHYLGIPNCWAGMLSNGLS